VYNRSSRSLCTCTRVYINLFFLRSFGFLYSWEAGNLSRGQNVPTVLPETTTATAESICSGGDRVGRVQRVEIVELDNISIEVCVFDNTSLITRGSLSGLVHIVAVVVLMAGRSGLLQRLRCRQQRQSRSLM